MLGEHLLKHSATFLNRSMLAFGSAFLASGLTVPIAVAACAAALRKVCEDLPNLSQESTNISGLLRVGEVVNYPSTFLMRWSGTVAEDHCLSLST